MLFLEPLRLWTWNSVDCFVYSVLAIQSDWGSDVKLNGQMWNEVPLLSWLRIFRILSLIHAFLFDEQILIGRVTIAFSSVM